MSALVILLYLCVRSVSFLSLCGTLTRPLHKVRHECVTQTSLCVHLNRFALFLFVSSLILFTFFSSRSNSYSGRLRARDEAKRHQTIVVDSRSRSMSFGLFFFNIFFCSSSHWLFVCHFVHELTLPRHVTFDKHKIMCLRIIQKWQLTISKASECVSVCVTGRHIILGSPTKCDIWHDVSVFLLCRFDYLFFHSFLYANSATIDRVHALFS